MIRRLIPLAVAIVLVVGCKKKKDDADDGKVDGDPNATYTIKIRDAQQGDKTQVTVSETNTEGGMIAGKAENNTHKKQYEYTQHIIEMPAGSKQPTKLTRSYTVAKRTDFQTKELKSLKIEGKTVNIEKTKFGYQYTADGKKLDFLDTMDIDSELRNAENDKIDVLLPKNPVKVGETWNIDPAALKALFGKGGPPVDSSKSKLTGTLTRAYTKDGKQWGIITFNLDIAIDSKVAADKGMETGSGTMKLEGTIDAVIDGSAPDGTLKMTGKINFNGTVKGRPINITAEQTSEKTMRSAK